MYMYVGPNMLHLPAKSTLKGHGQMIVLHEIGLYYFF